MSAPEPIRSEFRVGQIVHIGNHAKGDDAAHVVVDVVKDKVKTCYCGSDRWYAPKWHDARTVSLAIGDHNRHVRRARKWIAGARVGHDGWAWIDVGREKVVEIRIHHADYRDHTGAAQAAV